MSESDMQVILPVGSLLIIETGEYSDRHWSGPVRIAKPFSKQQVADRFRKQWKPKNEWEEYPNPDDFLPWLIKKGYVEQIDNCMNWHVGSYGYFQP